MIGKDKFVVVQRTDVSFGFDWHGGKFPSNQRLLVLETKKSYIKNYVQPVNGATTYSIPTSYNNGKIIDGNSPILVNGVPCTGIYAVYDGLLSANTLLNALWQTDSYWLYYLFIPFIADADNTPASRVFDVNKTNILKVLTSRF